MKPLVIYLDGEPHPFFQGAEVWMLATRLPPGQREAWRAGKIIFVDEAGNELGSGGALGDNQKVWTRCRGNHDDLMNG